MTKPSHYFISFQPYTKNEPISLSISSFFVFKFHNRLRKDKYRIKWKGGKNLEGFIVIIVNNFRTYLLLVFPLCPQSCFDTLSSFYECFSLCFLSRPMCIDSCYVRTNNCNNGTKNLQDVAYKIQYI